MNIEQRKNEQRSSIEQRSSATAILLYYKLLQMNNILPPLPLIDGALFIDNSGWLEGMSTCHRYLQYRQLNARVSAAEKPSLNFGTAIHTALELRYVRYANRPIDDAYYNDLAVLLTDFFNAHAVPADDWRGLNWAMELVRRYNDRYAQEEFNLLTYKEPIPCPRCASDSDSESHAGQSPARPAPCPFCLGSGKRSVIVELSFALPLYVHRGAEGSSPIPVYYTGRIDVPIRLDGRVYVMDHKTTSYMGSQFFDEMRISAQTRGYCWAFGSADVAGYVINGIRTKEPPDYVLAGKDYNRSGKARSAQTWWDETFQRERYLVDSATIDEWQSNTIDLVEEFFWHYGRGYLPQKTKWCTRYGRCAYYNVCLLQPSDRAFMLSSGDFTDNTWSPLNQPTQPKQ